MREFDTPLAFDNQVADVCPLAQFVPYGDGMQRVGLLLCSVDGLVIFYGDALYDSSNDPIMLRLNVAANDAVTHTTFCDVRPNQSPTDFFLKATGGIVGTRNGSLFTIHATIQQGQVNLQAAAMSKSSTVLNKLSGWLTGSQEAPTLGGFGTRSTLIAIVPGPRVKGDSRGDKHARYVCIDCILICVAKCLPSPNQA